MKIACIRPSMFGEPASDAMMPLVFAAIKSLTPADWTIDFFDERVKPLPKTINAEVVALTVETFAARRAYQLADQFRKEGRKVLMGGFHATTLPDECLDHADSILSGDAEGTWPEVLSDLKKEALKPRYTCSETIKPSDIHFDYSIFRHWRYKLIGLVQFGRGCKYACDFCSIHAFYGHQLKIRPIADVVEDIRQLKQKLLFFVDDNLFSDESRAAELFLALIPLKKKWTCQISMDIALKPELLKLMRESGCIMVLIGFESLNPDSLQEMGKIANMKCGDYSEVIRNIYDAGLMIFGTFVIGYDHDTKDTATQLLDFAMRNQFAFANFNPLMPMPATRLYQRLAQEGRLRYERWWFDADYHYGDALLTPSGMSPEELVRSCREARFAFNSLHSIARRLKGKSVNKKSFLNVFVYLIAGLISRREIYFKQGRALGQRSTSITSSDGREL